MFGKRNQAERENVIFEHAEDVFGNGNLACLKS